MNRDLLILFLSIVILFIPLFLFDGTGDSGDSILHYLAAKYAFQQPELFFDHWAKPVYVLLAAPFAQFGLMGAKVFNVVITILTLIFTKRIAQNLDIPNSFLVPIFILFSPLYFKLTYSGLTEPLFACLMMLGILLAMQNRLIWSLVAISFLPFVRSEGLVIAGVFGLYLLWQRDWKKLPLLAVGHVAYGIIGSWAHGNLFWVFKKIPYATTTEVYGSGDWMHYLIQINYTVGVPIYILFWLGVFCYLIQFIPGSTAFLSRAGSNSRIKESPTKYFTEESILIYGSIFAFLFAHTLFWVFGIFKSFGLNRVLIAIVPLICLIALRGLEFLEQVLPTKPYRFGRLVKYGSIIFVLIFPFTSNPAAIDWQKDMNLSMEQELAVEVGNYLKSQSFSESATWYFSAPYLSEVLNMNPYEWEKRRNISEGTLKLLKEGDLVVWDDWFAVVDSGVNLEMVSSIAGIELLKAFERESNGRMIKFVVFVKQ